MRRGLLDVQARGFASLRVVCELSPNPRPMSIQGEPLSVKPSRALGFAVESGMEIFPQIKQNCHVIQHPTSEWKPE